MVFHMMRKTKCPTFRIKSRVTCLKILTNQIKCYIKIVNQSKPTFQTLYKQVTRLNSHSYTQTSEGKDLHVSH